MKNNQLYVADGFEPSERAQRGAVITRRISGDPSLRLKKKEVDVDRDATEFYEVRGNFVLLKSGGPRWDSILNLTGVHQIRWDGQVLVFCGSPEFSATLSPNVSSQTKQKILKGIFESITNVCSRGSVRGVSNE